MGVKSIISTYFSMGHLGKGKLPFPNTLDTFASSLGP